MKRLFLFAAVPMLMLVSCRPDPKPALPDYNGKEIKLTAENSGLTTEESTVTTIVNIQIPDASEMYQLEISTGVKYKTTSGGHTEIYLSPGSYIKSISTIRVERLIIDFFGRQGTLFDVYSNNTFSGDPVEEHLSEIEATEPEDYGQVSEFSIQANGWSIKNNTEFNKPCLYYVNIIL